MSTKILQYDGHFEQTGEARCQIMDRRDRRLYKYASEDVHDYLRTITPTPGKRYVLVLAMSAGEYYGPNRNGDAFSECPVMIKGDWVIRPGETLPEHYQSFERHAKVYTHHVNKDPARSYGSVVKAFYNHTMHRVELLLEIDEQKAEGQRFLDEINGDGWPAVSMGCKIKYDVCLAPDTLITTRSGPKELQTVQLGDEVLTHQGRWRRVTRVFHTPSSSTPAVRISAQGLPTALHATTNHPYYALSAREDAPKQRPRTYNEEGRVTAIQGYEEPDFVEAGELKPRDYLLFPLPKHTNTEEAPIDPWLMGFHLADGCVCGRYRADGSWQATQVRFAVDERDGALLTRLKQTLQRENVTWTAHTDNGSDHGGYIIVCDIHFAAKLEKLGRTENKHVPTTAWHWKDADKRAFLAGWLDGDGCFSERTGNATGSTVLRSLALEFQQLAWSAGLACSARKTTQNGSGKGAIYRLNFGKPQCVALAPYSVKIDAKAPKRRADRLFLYEHAGQTYMAVRVTEIRNAALAETYNLAVEEDESYVAGGVAVHNCSICGNKAPTRAQYCEHVNGSNPSYGMNRLLSDGTRCFVWNPSPHLFDISFVFKPADRIGYMMKKVANTQPYELQSSAALGQYVDQLAEKRSVLQKASDIDKVISGELVHPQDSVTMSESEYHATKNMIRTMRPWFKEGVPNVSAEDIGSVAHRSLPELLSSFNVLGMSPTIVELFRFVCGQKGIAPNGEVERRLARSQGKVASAIADIPHALDQLEKLGVLRIDENAIRGDVMKVAAPLREKRALYKDYLARRYVPESVGPLAEETGVMDLLPGEDFSADRAYYSPTWETLEYRDPQTGVAYETTRRAAERADWENRKKELAEAAGMAGLLGVGTKLLTSRYPWLGAPALLGGGWLGVNLVKGQQMPRVRTRQGLEVPANTEFVEKRSSALETVVPLAGGALLTALLAQDYGSADPVSAPLSRAAAHHPVLTTIGTSATVGGGGALLRGLRNAAMKSASYHPTHYDDVPLGTVCLQLGLEIMA